MKTESKSVRAAPAVWARIDAAAEAAGVTRNEWVLNAVEDALACEAPPKPAAKPKPKAEPAPKIERARAALAAGEAKAAHLAHPRKEPEGTEKPLARKLDTSMVQAFDGGKRPTYQKGQAGRGKR